MKINRRLCGLVFAGAALAITAAPASAETVLNFNSQVLENTVSGSVEKWFADEVARRSGGELTIRVFFGEGLGKMSENLTLLQDGAIDMASMSAGFFSAELPLTAAPNSIPMSLDTVAEAMELMQRLLAEVPAIREEHERNGIRALFFHNLNEYYLLSTKPLTTFESVRGERIRTWGAEMPKLATAAGAVPVTVSFSEVYEGLASGVITVAPISYDYARDYKLYEVAKNMSTVPAFVGPTGGVWISESAWDGLSQEHQTLLLEVAAEALQLDYDRVTGAAQAARAELEANGVTIHEFPKEELEKWQAANPDFFAEFVASREAAGQGDAAREMVRIWQEVRAGE